MTSYDDSPTERNAKVQHESDNLVIEPIQFSRAEIEQRGWRPRVRPIPIMIAAILVALLAVAWFMFTARAVSVAITPTPDRIDVDGGLLVYQLGDRYLVRPGSYRVHAEKSGYHPLDQTIEVGEQQEQDFAFEMAKLPGILEVTTSSDAPADLYIDQQLIGQTPFRHQALEPGLHDIAIRSERYLPYDSEIEIEGMQREQTLHAELSPAWGDVTIDSRPRRAVVSVDGTDLGNTPATLEILEGTRELQVSLAGYKSWQSALDVTAGDEITLPTVELIPADGRLSLRSSPSGAAVTIADSYRGETPLSLALAPGAQYAIELTKPGYEPVRRTVRIRPDEDIDLNLSLVPVLAVVQLVVTPPGAELILDGKSLGEPNQRLELPASRHRVVVRKQGYAPYDGTITPRPGFDQQIRIALKTVEQARAEAIPQTIVTAAGQEMRLIVPSRLQMGAPRGAPGARPNEAERTVTLTRPFYASTMEISNRDFLEFASSHESGSVGRALLNQEERPVVNVTWEDAVAYANWLSEKDGLPPVYRQEGDAWIASPSIGIGYRLPTEAEWAWIARYAGTGAPTRFPWGDAMPPVAKSGNYADITARDLVPYHIKSYDDGYLGTAPGGSFPANPLGLYDLAGNVAEWIHDVYVANPRISGFDPEDPTGPERGEYHVIRGSSFMHGRFSELRWTYRDYGAKARPDVGFRLARYLEDQGE